MSLRPISVRLSEQEKAQLQKVDSNLSVAIRSLLRDYQDRRNPMLIHALFSHVYSCLSETAEFLYELDNLDDFTNQRREDLVKELSKLVQHLQSYEL